MIRIYSAIAAVLILYGWMGSEDLQAQQDSAAYTAEIMEQARIDELNKPRETLNRMQEDAGKLLALQEVK